MGACAATDSGRAPWLWAKEKALSEFSLCLRLGCDSRCHLCPLDRGGLVQQLLTLVCFQTLSKAFTRGEETHTCNKYTQKKALCKAKWGLTKWKPIDFDLNWNNLEPGNEG